MKRDFEPIYPGEIFAEDFLGPDGRQPISIGEVDCHEAS